MSVIRPPTSVWYCNIVLAALAVAVVADLAYWASYHIVVVFWGVLLKEARPCGAHIRFSASDYHISYPGGTGYRTLLVRVWNRPVGMGCHG